MEDSIHGVIEQCLRFRLTEILFVMAVVLVLVDYFFPTDWPAHIGYFCLAAAMFFVAYLNAFSLLVCLGAAVGFWLLMAFLHRTLFRHFLTNAPGTEPRDLPT